MKREAKGASTGGAFGAVRRRLDTSYSGSGRAAAIVEIAPLLPDSSRQSALPIAKVRRVFGVGEVGNSRPR